jgi:hypothetical protein
MPLLGAVRLSEFAPRYCWVIYFELNWLRHNTLYSPTTWSDKLSGKILSSVADSLCNCSAYRWSLISLKFVYICWTYCPSSWIMMSQVPHQKDQNSQPNYGAELCCSDSHIQWRNDSILHSRNSHKPPNHEWIIFVFINIYKDVHTTLQIWLIVPVLSTHPCLPLTDSLCKPKCISLVLLNWHALDKHLNLEVTPYNTEWLWWPTNTQQNSRLNKNTQGSHNKQTKQNQKQPRATHITKITWGNWEVSLSTTPVHLKMAS